MRKSFLIWPHNRDVSWILSSGHDQRLEVGKKAFLTRRILFENQVISVCLKTLLSISPISRNPITLEARSTNGISLGLVFTDGQRWASQRKFTVRQLKNFGFGSQKLETVMVREALELVDHLLNEGPSLKVDTSLFSLSALNVLWGMVAGKTFSRDDKGIGRLLDLNTFLFSSEIFLVALFTPWIRHVFPSLSGYNEWLEGVNGIKEEMRRQIKEHETVLDMDDPKDFIDAYLIEMKSNPDPEFNMEQLVMIGHDLMSAGTETVATTMNWVMLYLALYPEDQERCSLEIGDVLGGRQQVVKLSDMDSLPLCQATIAEIQRLALVGVSSLPHMISKEVILKAH